MMRTIEIVPCRDGRPMQVPDDRDDSNYVLSFGAVSVYRPKAHRDLVIAGRLSDYMPIGEAAEQLAKQLDLISGAWIERIPSEQPLLDEMRLEALVSTDNGPQIMFTQVQVIYQGYHPDALTAMEDEMVREFAEHIVKAWFS